MAARGSLAYANLRRALLAAVRAIPPGHVVEVGTLAAALNVPARHVAYMLAQLDADEIALVPVHRVVPTGGILNRGVRDRPGTAARLALLASEGITIEPSGRIRLDPDRLHRPPDTHRSTIWADLDGPED